MAKRVCISNSVIAPTAPKHTTVGSGAQKHTSTFERCNPSVNQWISNDRSGRAVAELTDKRIMGASHTLCWSAWVTLVDIEKAKARRSLLKGYSELCTDKHWIERHGTEHIIYLMNVSKL
jgi:hypothetical protein